jgi:hypothetical protein
MFQEVSGADLPSTTSKRPAVVSREAVPQDPPWQLWPHVPQFIGSLVVSTQLAAQHAVAHVGPHGLPLEDDDEVLEELAAVELEAELVVELAVELLLVALEEVDTALDPPAPPVPVLDALVATLVLETALPPPVPHTHGR